MPEAKTRETKEGLTYIAVHGGVAYFARGLDFFRREKGAYVPVPPAEVPRDVMYVWEHRLWRSDWGDAT